MASFQIYGLELEVPEHLLTPGITRALEKGWYERDEVEIARARLVPGDRVIELGAGLGVTAMVAAKAVGADNIMAFEANPGLLPVARANAARNGLAVRFENRVLMPRDQLPASGQVHFKIEPAFWASSLSDDQTGLAVPAGALEDAIASFGANALVMDIEGMEVSLIEAVDLSAINKFIFEIHYEKHGRKRANAAVEKLIAGGCEIDYVLSSRGVLYLERSNPS